MTLQEDQEVLNLTKGAGARVWKGYRVENAGQVTKIDFTPEQFVAFVERIRQEQKAIDAIISTDGGALEKTGFQIAEAILKG